jgi:hypothetical protein
VCHAYRYPRESVPTYLTLHLLLQYAVIFFGACERVRQPLLNRAVTCLPRLPQHPSFRSPSLSPQRGTRTPRYLLLSRHPHILYNPTCVLALQTAVFPMCFASFSLSSFYLYPYLLTTSHVIGYFTLFPTVLTKIGSQMTAKLQIFNPPTTYMGSCFIVFTHSLPPREYTLGPLTFASHPLIEVVMCFTHGVSPLSLV